ncbi:hypothetical protein [Nocardia africana]|uniref:hypothetical protein n=1 Tax=Nocardia africana TaxID=134964 RepID=UPI000FE2690E|nr:hypothetical protein [Nocardia africana]
MAQTDGRPAEYRWGEHWPRSSGGGYVLLGTCVLVLAAVPGPPLLLHVAVGINGLMFLASSRTPRRPAVRIVDGVAVLGWRPYSHAPTLLFLVVSLYGAALAGGAIAGLVPAGFLGVGLVALCFGITVVGLCLSLCLNRMTFGPDTLRVVCPVQGYDREFAWCEVTGAAFGAGPGRAAVPVVSVTCPATAVVERSSARLLSNEVRPTGDQWPLPAGGRSSPMRYWPRSNS